MPHTITIRGVASAHISGLMVQAEEMGYTPELKSEPETTNGSRPRMSPHATLRLGGAEPPPNTNIATVVRELKAYLDEHDRNTCLRSALIGWSEMTKGAASTAISNAVAHGCIVEVS